MRLFAWCLVCAFLTTTLRAGLVNISARGTTAAGADSLTAGFVIVGEAPKRVLLPAAGPALASLGVAGALAQVRLDVYRGATPIAKNAGWDTGNDAVALAQIARTVGAFEFAGGSRDAALLLVLVPGTEPGGRIAVSNSVNLDRAAGVDQGFEVSRMAPVSGFRWNPPAAATGLGAWPQTDSGVMPAGYVPASRSFGDYLDANDYLPANLAQVGVLVPADAQEAERLRRLLQADHGSEVGRVIPNPPSQRVRRSRTAL